MLNPHWEKYNWAQDLALWTKLVDLINDDFRYMPGSFFETYEKQIDHLYGTYYRTKSGGSPDPNRATRQKFQIMQHEHLFEELEYVAALTEQDRSNKWEQQSLKDESLDAKLEREKNHWEAKKEEASRTSSKFKISKRFNSNL